MTKRLVAALVVALGMLTFAAVASAEPKVDSSQRLQVQIDPNQSGCNTVDSIAGWVTGQDSPSDSNQHLFHTNVGTPVGCVLLFSNASFNRHVAVGNQKNISIQLRTTSVSLGLNYMVAEVSTDGNNSTTEDTLFLDPADCNHPVGSSTTWVRADFTGFKGDNSLHHRRGLASVGDVLVRRGALRVPELRARPPRGSRDPQVRRDREPQVTAGSTGSPWAPGRCTTTTARMP